MQGQHVYPMKSDAPFSVIPGGLARFDEASPNETPLKHAIGEVRWTLREVSTGRKLTAVLRATSDHEVLYGELATDLPLKHGMVYQTLSVSAQANINKTSKSTAQTQSRHRLGLARGTRVMTDSGERPVESLRAGDRVITRDHGMQPIIYVGRQDITVTGANAPVLIGEGVLKNARDLIVSVDTRIVLKGAQALARFGAREVLIPARDLVDGKAIRQGVGGAISFYQIVTEHHQVIYAEAAAVESYLADDAGLSALEPGNRASLEEALPVAPKDYGPCPRRYVDVRI